MTQFDYLLVGGGLQNALIAEALCQLRPSATLAVVEQGSVLGGNHTWCFHAADVPAKARCFVDPFVVERWQRQSVRFPDLERTLEEPYAALASASVQGVLAERAARGALSLYLGERALRVGVKHVELESGTRLEAQVVIDARGPELAERRHVLGYQKFLGLELEVEPESRPSSPVLMDACVEQSALTAHVRYGSTA